MVIKERWEGADILRCSHLRSEENLVGYKTNEPPSFWLALNKDPCPTCDNRFCHNYKSKFDDPKRLIILKLSNLPIQKGRRDEP